MKSKLLLITIGLLLIFTGSASAGFFSTPLDDPANMFDPPIYKTDDAILYWADAVIDYSPAPGVSPAYQNPEAGYGSLGDLTANQIAAGVAPGSITVGFSDGGISNSTGQDFAVFENGMAYGSPNGVFMELAFVEVSSNGSDFARFDSISTNTSPVAGSGGFSGWDSTNVYNLAGKNQSGWGTTFDLDDLLQNELVLGGFVDLDNILYVRLVDIPGTGDYLDSYGNPILDAHPTVGSGGFDFRLSEGVAVLNAAAPAFPTPVPGSILLMGSGLLLLVRKRNHLK